MQIEFGQEKKCKTVCTRSYDLGASDDQKKLAQLKKGMGMNYQHHWIVDNMPVRITPWRCHNRKVQVPLLNR